MNRTRRERSTLERIRFGVWSLATALLLSGCGEHPLVTLYDHNLTHTPIPCLALQVSPPDPTARKTITALYPFKAQCPYTLILTTKEEIVCHSFGNAPKKATSDFPSAYLRMELHRGMDLLYSYYVDLTHAPEASDIRHAFERLQKDLHLQQ